MTSQLQSAAKTIVVVGKESVGKSQLVSCLAGRSGGTANFRGTTVAVERFATKNAVYIDTPGILRRSDTETTRRALQALQDEDVVLLVVQATQLDDDLADMLPLVCGKRGAVIVTFWDKVQHGEAALEALERLSRESGVPFVAVDARNLGPAARSIIYRSLDKPSLFTEYELKNRAGWRIEPRPGLLEHQFAGPVLAFGLLLLPAGGVVFGANRLADWLHPIVAGWIQPLVESINTKWPWWARLVLTAERGQFGYGLLNMGPFLLVWALPTVLFFAVVLGIYKASGLVERINVALHPLVRPLGLSGRDVVRIVMGLGCNVPAVISTRACSGCSRGTAIAAIAFGAACSYQLPATLAVLAAAASANGRSPLVLTMIFLAYLLVTTLVYLRLTSPSAARNSLNLLLIPRRPFMQWPAPGALWREVAGTIRQFFLQALPVFVVICAAASLLTQLGVLETGSRVLGPVMRAFNLPSEAALPVILASIRKDGIFLFASEDGHPVPLSAAQALTAVYLAGVLLPCLVTAIAIGRETTWRTTATILARQSLFAIGFSLVLAWGGKWFL